MRIDWGLILDALLDDKVALDATIIEWIDRYTEDETAAMTEIVNFILRVPFPHHNMINIPVLWMSL